MQAALKEGDKDMDGTSVEWVECGMVEKVQEDCNERQGSVWRGYGRADQGVSKL